MAVVTEPGDLRTDPCFLGRSRELYTIVRNLALGRHTLCIGPRGIGKSRLMREAIAVLNGTRPLPAPVPPAGLRNEMLFQRVKAGSHRIMVVTHTTPLGECLLEIAQALHSAHCLPVERRKSGPRDWDAVRSRLKRQGRARLQDLILQSMRDARPPWLVFFDSLDGISPTYQPFIEALLSCAVVCAAVLVPKERAVFRKIWSSFVPLELAPLSREESLALIDHCLLTYRIRVTDPGLYRREILKICAGNPFLIRTILWMGSRSVHVDSEEIARLRQESHEDLFNMGPLYILAASVLTNRCPGRMFSTALGISLSRLRDSF